MDVLRTHLLQIEKNYQIKFSEDEIAYLTQMFLENKIKNYDESAHNFSV
jgi:transcriptional regulatory protein LevR